MKHRNCGRFCWLHNGLRCAASSRVSTIRARHLWTPHHLGFADLGMQQDDQHSFATTLQTPRSEFRFQRQWIWTLKFRTSYLQPRTGLFARRPSSLPCPTPYRCSCNRSWRVRFGVVARPPLIPSLWRCLLHHLKSQRDVRSPRKTKNCVQMDDVNATMKLRRVAWQKSKIVLNILEKSHTGCI